MRKKEYRNLFILIMAVVLTLGISISLQSLLAAWTPPTAVPPNNNPAEPINKSDVTQEKTGMLLINTIGNSTGFVVASGNVGIGTTNPTSVLTVTGTGSVPTVGTEKVTNGDFTSISNWIWGTGWNRDTANNEADHISGTGGVAAVLIDDGGSGYAEGDVLTISGGGGNAQVTVVSIVQGSPGKVWTVTMTATGTAYSVASGLATTGGSGSGCKISISRLEDDATLEQNVPLLGGGRSYEVKYTVKNRTKGEIMVSLGGYPAPRVSINSTFDNIIGYSTGNMTFTPTKDFDGSIDDVSVKQLTESSAVASFLNSDGTKNIEIRSGGSGLSNLFIGSNAGKFSYHTAATSTGQNNTAVGINALINNTIGNSNTAFGYTLISNTTGSGNSAFGNNTLNSNTTGGLNSAFGYYSLVNNVSGVANSAFGGYSLGFNTASNNSAFGYVSLRYNTTGASNAAFGAYALYANTLGTANIAVGYSALSHNTTGSSNVAVGADALFVNTTGNNNIALGNIAGGNITSGSNNIIIGNNIYAPSATSSYQMSIGNLIYGTGVNGSGVTPSSGNVGIGTTNPTKKLDVAGDIKVSGDVCNGAGKCLSSSGSADLTGWRQEPPGCGGHLTSTSTCYTVAYASGVYMDCDGSRNGSSAPRICSTFLFSDGHILYRMIHTEKNCTDAGGSLADDGTNYFCRFTTNSCGNVPGWAQMNYWTETTPQTCPGTNSGGCSGATTVTTGQHTFANINPTLEARTYYSSYYNYCCYITYNCPPGTWHPVGSWCEGGDTCNGCCNSSGGTCSATISSVGCY